MAAEPRLDRELTDEELDSALGGGRRLRRLEVAVHDRPLAGVADLADGRGGSSPASRPAT